MAGSSGHGITLTINSQAVGGIKAIPTPTATREALNTTDNASTYTESIPSNLRDSQEMAVVCNLIVGDVGQDEVRSNFSTDGAAASVAVVFTYPGPLHTTTVTESFNAFVTSIGGSDQSQDADAVLEFPFTLMIDGPITYNVAP